MGILDRLDLEITPEALHKLTCEGQPYTSIAGQKLMRDNLRDLECWINLANLMSKKEIVDKYECA